MSILFIPFYQNILRILNYFYFKIIYDILRLYKFLKVKGIYSPSKKSDKKGD